MDRKYLLQKDIDDERDFIYKASKPKIYKSVDLRKLQSSVMDQGSLGSCSANALSSMIDFVRIKNNKPPLIPSRLFIYYNERLLENSISEDSGASLRDGIKSVVTQGVCSEINDWQYDISKFTIKPPDNCYTDALKDVITQYHRLNTLTDMKDCLTSGNCFIFGLQLYESFESEQVAKTGIVPMPSPNEQLLGGHALFCVGFIEETNQFIVKNSWSENWGLKGYCCIPYQYMSNPNFALDFWTITDEKM